MRKFLIVIVVLIVGVALLFVYNHYDVQSGGDAIAFDPDAPVLRTPDTAFNGLTDFPYAPHYVDIEDTDLGTLRVHYLDEGPADGHTTTSISRIPTSAHCACIISTKVPPTVTRSCCSTARPPGVIRSEK